MDFGWTEEDEAFRSEVIEFIRQELPPDWGQQAEAEGGRDDFEREFARKLGSKGWLTPSWPVEYGGKGWSIIQQMIFNEELAKHKAPLSMVNAGVNLAGPSIMVHGTEEQKQKYLPGIASGEAIWCQLFSEPNAGSDLPSLQTKAEPKGDYYLLNGQKTWTTQGHHAQYGILLARTDQDAPKHKGISYFLLDLSLPGVSRRPIINMADVHHFNEFFFDNVELPRDTLVGEENRGWYVGATTLNFERSGLRASVPALQLMEELLAFAREGVGGYKPFEQNAGLRHKVADMTIQLHIGRLLAYRTGWLQASGQVPSYESSMGRIFGAETTQRLTQLGMELLGLWSQPTHESALNVLRGKVQKLYRGQRAITIGAGTSEIQRNTIAMRGLGLPRG